jgi:DNA modification methylase
VIAALEVKRNAWGCDIDKEYCAQGILKLDALRKGEQETVVEDAV